MSLFSRENAKSALEKTGLLSTARSAYKSLHFYSGLVSVRQNDIARIRSGLALLEPQSAVGFHKVRVGAEHDGGYVMLNDFAGISAALSLGIGWEATWDFSIADRGIPVLQYDHTIETSPISHKLCKFARRKVVATRPSNASEISIEDILCENNIGASEDLLLKIDVEGAEWDILSALDDRTLGQFRQILCEFHAFYRIGQPAWRRRAFKVFEKLTRDHCVLHVHGNNFQGPVCIGNVMLPEVIEVTFVRRKDYELCESPEQFPTELDRPNNPGAPEISLGSVPR